MTTQQIATNTRKRATGRVAFWVAGTTMLGILGGCSTTPDKTPIGFVGGTFTTADGTKTVPMAIAASRTEGGLTMTLCGINANDLAALEEGKKVVMGLDGSCMSVQTEKGAEWDETLKTIATGLQIPQTVFQGMIARALAGGTGTGATSSGAAVSLTVSGASSAGLKTSVPGRPGVGPASAVTEIGKMSDGATANIKQLVY